MGARIRICLVAIVVPAAASMAEDGSVLTPRVIIYPGETIRADMLAETPSALTPGEPSVSRSALIGRIARKTLFPGQMIAETSVEDAKLVANGGHVQLTYERSGISITAAGQALQAGRVGDVIRVRNSESGIVVTGVVAPSGAVVVGQ